MCPCVPESWEGGGQAKKGTSRSLLHVQHWYGSPATGVALWFNGGLIDLWVSPCPVIPHCRGRYWFQTGHGEHPKPASPPSTSCARAGGGREGEPAGAAASETTTLVFRREFWFAPSPTAPCAMVKTPSRWLLISSWQLWLLCSRGSSCMFWSDY